eukprot:TRINITY_DN1643_c0_g1_i7.p1 TRINITY_DN1643_c0_g1~~TRINITY_DN1643_c0_g1_i7.p1  ORF type:complete len:204 (-),score=56.75 TRINITY_DN1643_c0_g1_i7:20-631(-)
MVLSVEHEDQFEGDQFHHWQGVVTFLQERLKTVFSSFAVSKELRIRQMLEQETRTLKVLRKQYEVQKGLEERQKGSGGKGTSLVQIDEEMEAQLNGGTLQRVLEKQNKGLLEELNSKMDQVEHIQQQMQEISTLQTLFETNVWEQKEKIEALHQDAEQQIDLVKDAHHQFTEASKNLRGNRLCFLVMFIVLSFSLLFLHWYSP